MPEGHTIHRLARDQRRDLRGHKVDVSSPQGRFADSALLLDRHVVENVDAFGKHLFTRFDTGDVLHVHLGLIGKFRRQPSPPVPPVGIVRLRVEGPTATWDLSGPNVCRIVDPAEMERVIATLGPDPLRRGADRERFVAAVQRSAKPIGALLLDQSVIAGVGNVFRAEVLFVHGVHPSTPGVALDRVTIEAMWDTLARWLRDGVRRNRIVTNTIRDPLFVYHREACPTCGTPLVTDEVGGRRIQSCPMCQPAPQ
jgi:formamidopyrimidine-DNA glycosylase